MRQRFAIDLTDTQWAHVRTAVFGPHPDPVGLREVVNALRYREHARVPWALLPPGFPPTEDLRGQYERWQADGTWERVRAVVKAYPAPRLRPGASNPHRLRRAAGPFVRVLARLRRRIARTARTVPGGPALLYPGRWVIQFAQAVARRFTVHARLPAWFARAHTLLFVEEDYAAAAAVLTRVLAYDPYNAPAYLRRAYCYLKLDRLTESSNDCWALLALPEITAGDRGSAHATLSQVLVLLGDADRAVDHGYLGRLIHRFGDDARCGGDGRPTGPDEYELLLETHRDLAEYAINTRTDFETAGALYRRADEARAGYARWLAEVPGTTLYLNEDWTRNIGHMALIDFWVKMHRLGWQTWDRMVLLSSPGRVANPSYAGYFGTYFETLAPQAVPPGLRHLVTTFGPRVAGHLHLPDGSPRYFTEGMGLVQEAWEKAGHGPLLQLTPEDVEYGRNKLRAMGVPDGAWFVSLHVRSPGFHKEGKLAHQSHRNADIRSYLPAVREVVRRGGWVIRMGDASMPPFPPTPGVIDYARGRFKSPRMDVFLCGGCRFFVGVASGISHVPTTFGVPCVLTNWLSNAFPVFSTLDLFVPKLLRSTRDGRLLPFDEYLDPATRLLCYSGDKLAESDLEVVDNSPDELRDVVAEMLDQLEAGRPAPPTARVTEFDDLARRHGLAGFSRVGRAFVDTHRELLPARAYRRTA